MSIRTNEHLYLPGNFKYFKTAYGKLHHYIAIQTGTTEIVFKKSYSSCLFKMHIY